jgi:hypothetical protein
MNSVIVLSEKDNAFKSPVVIIRRVFADWDLATLYCAKSNFESTDKSYFYLTEVPFEGEISAGDCEISHCGEEITICWGEDEIIAEVKLEQDVDEELFHQECPPNTKPTYNVESITICGTALDNLRISDELKRAIEHEADNYRDEMIERIGEPDD